MMTNAPTPADLARRTNARMFTQDELDARIAEAMRKQREQYADYEQLKARAADSDRLERELEEVRGAAAEVERETLLDRLQRQHGFDDEDVRLFLRSHEGDNDSLVDRAERIAAVLKSPTKRGSSGPLIGPSTQFPVPKTPAPESTHRYDPDDVADHRDYEPQEGS